MFGECPLWEGYTHYQVMYKLTVEGVHPPISHLPSEMQEICKSCFAEKVKWVNSVAALNKILQLAKLGISDSSPVALARHGKIVMDLFLY